MTVREQIDIEQLLVWAYRTQCVDRQAVSFSPKGPSSSPTGSLDQFMALGTRVDSSSFATRALSFRMPDDALVIHDLVLSLADMWLEWRADDEVVVWGRTKAAREGQVIDKREGRWLRWPAYSAGHIDAAPVALEEAGVVGLIIPHAKNNMRPECYIDWRAPQGRVAADGRDRDTRGRKRKRGDGVAWAEVCHARALYLAWHAALSWLAVALQGQLQGFEVTGPEAPESPWQKPGKRVFLGLKCQKHFEDNILK